MNHRSIAAALGLIVAVTVTHEATGAPSLRLDSAVIPVCTTAGTQFDPRTVSGGAGGTIVTWSDHRAGSFAPNIFSQRIGPSGDLLWGTGGVAASTQNTTSDIFKVCSDGSGGVIIAWSDQRTSSADVYVQRINAAGQRAWAPAGVAIATGPSEQVVGAVAADGTGGAVVAWHASNGNFYAQRVGATGELLWGSSGLGLCTVLGAKGTIQMIPDGAGGVIAAWDDGRQGNGWSVYAQRLNSSGAPQWVTNGVVLSTDLYVNMRRPAIIPDGSDGAFVAWFSSAGARVARIGSGGASVWPGGDVELGAGPPWESTSPALVSDGQGGAIVAFSGASSLIRVQRISAHGVALWPLGFRPVATTSYVQSDVSMIADGAGGAVLTWSDLETHPSDWNVSAQRINESGSRLWSEAGTEAAGGPGDQTNPRVAFEGSGAAFVAWESGSGDILGTRLANATVDAPEVAIAAPSLRAAPNPLTRGQRATVNFGLSRPGLADIEILDVSGRRVQVLARHEFPAGRHAAYWDGRLENGQPARAGIYFVSLRTEGAQLHQRLILLD